MNLKTQLSFYFSLTKPGIIAGNLIATAAGFFLASKGQVDWLLFSATMLSIIFIIGSACVFNNVIDRDIDMLMERTCNRVLVKGLVSVNGALVAAVLLGFAGFSIAYFMTNTVALFMGALGFVVYVGLYSLYFKRKSIYGTAVGSISGACPPVMGYCAVTGQFDIGALILLAIFCVWQIPHSYAIAIYRFKDYSLANIPILPLRSGFKTARDHIISYILVFIGVCLLLTQQNYAGIIYASCMTLLGLYWTYIAVTGFSEKNQQVWGKKLFVFSIITICCFSLLISFDFVVEETVLAGIVTEILSFSARG